MSRSHAYRGDSDRQLAALARHAVLDTATQQDAEHLEALAEAALGVPPTASYPVRDDYTYTVAVNGRTIECSIWS
ncbi:hypothetical protein [Streptomyces fagopyri]